MMKRLSLILLLITGFGLNSMAQHDPNDQIMSANWDVIGGVDFKTVKETEMYAIFTNEIKKHAGKPFELEGYIV
ncbi:MAG: hypothetical protein ACQUHE_11740, partial [Bacteroidia bacterium]